jgi:hypothetical protein
MELADVWGYLGVFLGGGVGGAWLKHRWEVKSARDAALWPRDVERIDKLRELCRAEYSQHIDKVCHKRPTTSDLEQALKTLYSPDIARLSNEVEGDRWVFELEDEQLHRRWYEFKLHSRTFVGAYRLAKNQDQQIEATVEYKMIYEDVLRRLNELERGRS